MVNGCKKSIIIRKHQAARFTVHHGKARPQVADGKDGLQTWKEAAKTC
jgi:hypothetical protein